MREISSQRNFISIRRSVNIEKYFPPLVVYDRLKSLLNQMNVLSCSYLFNLFTGNFRNLTISTECSLGTKNAARLFFHSSGPREEKHAPTGKRTLACPEGRRKAYEQHSFDFSLFLLSASVCKVHRGPAFR